MAMERICPDCGGSHQGNRSYCCDCEAKRSRTWRAAHLEQARAADRARSVRWREQVLDHYGRACACCGSTYKLTVDHVKGGGAAHRRRLHGSPNGGSVKLCRWLIRQGFPAGFQTLCLACNLSKNDGPACRIDHARQWEGVAEAFLAAPQDQREQFLAWLQSAA